MIQHLAEVYEHKLACTELEQRPDPWPPQWPADREPTVWFDDVRARLIQMFQTSDPSRHSYTWFPPDQTVGFWARRMAHETAVHRVDLELAAGTLTPLDPALAVDGTDEVLRVCLAGDWSDEPPHDPAGEGVIEVAAGTARWRVELKADWVEVTDQPSNEVEPQALLQGEPSSVMLWCWGRLPISEVTVSGAQATVQLLRQRLREATQ